MTKKQFYVAFTILATGILSLTLNAILHINIFLIYGIVSSYLPMIYLYRKTKKMK